MTLPFFRLSLRNCSADVTNKFFSIVGYEIGYSQHTCIEKSLKLRLLVGMDWHVLKFFGLL